MKGIFFICSYLILFLSHSCFAMNRPLTPDRSQTIVTHATPWKYQATIKTSLISNFSKQVYAAIDCTVPYRQANCPTVLTPIISAVMIPPVQHYDQKVVVQNLSSVTEYALLLLIEAGHTKALTYDVIKSAIEMLTFKEIRVETKLDPTTRAYWIIFNKLDTAGNEKEIT